MSAGWKGEGVGAGAHIDAIYSQQPRDSLQRSRQDVGSCVQDSYSMNTSKAVGNKLNKCIHCL